jgi:LuxR family maltose regulon positive regulatory protein
VFPDQGRLAPREILDYFGNEFFNQTDPQVRDFLLRTAWLPMISLPAARQLSGLSQADRILAELNRNNTFTERQASVEPIYQYHPLFREFLLTRAKGTYSPETLSTLQNQAAALLEREGQIEAAVELFQGQADWGAIKRLIMAQGAALVEQGRIGPLEAWLSSLPRDFMEDDPWLLYWMGICRLPVAPPQSRPWFEKALERFLPRRETAGICLSLWGVVHSVIYAMADFNPLDRWIGLLEDLGRKIRDFPSVEIELRFVSAMFSALVYRQPQHPEIAIWEQKALSLAERTSNPNLRIQTMATVALYRSTTGDFARAQMAIDFIRKWSPARESTPLMQIRLRAIEAAHYKYQGSHAACMQAVGEGLNVSRTTGIALFAPMLCYHGATSALGMNDYPSARTLIEQMTSSLERFRPYDLVIYHSLKTQEALFLGDYKQAFLHIEKATQLRKEAGFDLINGWCHIQNAYVMHVLGRHREADDFLAQALQFAEKIKGKNNAYAARLAEAHFAFDQGREEAGLTALGKAFALGRENGNYSTWGPPRPSDMARLCRKALEAGIEVDYVQEFIRRFHLLPDRTAVALEKWPWPLRIYTLGRFALVKDGKPVQFSGKIQKKPLLLLKALIALGGRNVAEERLTDILWPEADGDRAYSALTTTLFRLRQLIGETMLEVQNGGVSLNPQYCWVDAWTFETMRERPGSSSGASGTGDGRSDAVWRMGKALELYRGPFLAEEGAGIYWVLPYREKLQERFIHLTTLLGRSLEEQGLWDQAVSCYRKGLEADNLAEELYCRLMFCYGRLGDTARAARVYRSLKNTLSSMLGVAPSPGTEILYRTLTARQQPRS